MAGRIARPVPGLAIVSRGIWFKALPERPTSPRQDARRSHAALWPAQRAAIKIIPHRGQPGDAEGIGPLLVVIASRRPPAALTATAASADPAALAPVNLLENTSLSPGNALPDGVRLRAGEPRRVALRRNRESFDALRLKSHVLVDVGALDTRLELFGQRFDFPILIAPTANHGLAHPEGELATARGRRRGRDDSCQHLRQPLPRGDRAIGGHAALQFRSTRSPTDRSPGTCVQRAEAAGCKVVCITVDARRGPRARSRETRRASIGLAPSTRPWPRTPSPGSARSPGSRSSSRASSPRKMHGWPLIAAPRACSSPIAAGVDLDSTPATIQRPPGRRRGADRTAAGPARRRRAHRTDVVKAVALGPQAVLIGRPPLSGPRGRRREWRPAGDREPRGRPDDGDGALRDAQPQQDRPQRPLAEVVSGFARTRRTPRRSRVRPTGPCSGPGDEESDEREKVIACKCPTASKS